MQYEIVIRFTSDRALTEQQLNDLIYAATVQVEEPWDPELDTRASYTTQIDKAYVYPSQVGA